MKHWLPAICLAGLPAAAYAQTTLSEVVVTATRTPLRAGQTAKPLSVLSDSLLQARPAATLSQLLGSQPGLYMPGSNLSPGSLQAVYMRGATSGYTLVLLDGLPLYDVSSVEGNFDLNLMPVGALERAEILKGGQSTLYGSDAMAGVIHLISRKSSEKPLSGLARLSYGSFHTLRADASVQLEQKGWGLSLSGGGEGSRGFSSAYDVSAKNKFEADGLQSRYLRGRVSRQLGSRWQLYGTAAYTRYRAGLDAGTYTDDADFRAAVSTLQAGAGAVLRAGNSRWHFNYLFTDTHRRYENDSMSVASTATSRYSLEHYRARTHLVEAYLERRLSARWQWLAGGDLRWQNTDQDYVSISAYGPYRTLPLKAAVAQARTASLYSNLILSELKGFGSAFGIRLNNHSLFSNHLTYSLNPYYRVGNHLRLTANLSTGFRAPSLYALYSAYGNLGLRPETALTTDLGLELSPKRLQLRLVYFHRQTRNGLFFESLNQAPYGRYRNLNRQQAHGIEAEVNLQAGGFVLTANHTYTAGRLFTRRSDGRDTVQGTLLRIPKHLTNLHLSRRLSGKAGASLSLQAVGSRADAYYDARAFKSISLTLPGYVLLGADAYYDPRPQWRIFAQARNLTNRRYEELAGYTGRPLSLTAGVQLNY